MAKIKSAAVELFPKGYRGFLIVQCQRCGNEWAFCSREYIQEAQCRCGEAIPMEGMRVAFAHCECGYHAMYRTNARSGKCSCKCLNCGSKIKMRLNARKNAFVTKEKGGVLFDGFELDS